MAFRLILSDFAAAVQKSLIRRLNKNYEVLADPDKGSPVAVGVRSVAKFLFYGGCVYSAGVLFQMHLFTWSLATGPSMYPTFPVEDHFTVIDKRYAHGKGLKVGDVIRFQSPIFRGQYVGKRIIGMPGDYVVRDQRYAPTVGGAPVPSTKGTAAYDRTSRMAETKLREEPELIRVPEGHVWVAGDNMAWSRDSRFFGPVPMALIDGKTILSKKGLFKPSTWYTKDQLQRIPKEQEAHVLAGGLVQDRLVTEEVKS